jgi:hypothetical protein
MCFLSLDPSYLPFFSNTIYHCWYPNSSFLHGQYPFTSIYYFRDSNGSHFPYVKCCDHGCLSPEVACLNVLELLACSNGDHEARTTRCYMYELDLGSQAVISWTVKQVNTEIMVDYILCVMWMYYHTFSFYGGSVYVTIACISYLDKVYNVIMFSNGVWRWLALRFPKWSIFVPIPVNCYDDIASY